MKKKAFYSISFALMAGMFLLNSCNLDEQTSSGLNDADIEQAEDDAVADDVYTTVDAMVDDEISTLDANNYNANMHLKTVSDKTSDPFVCKVVTVDHPDSTHFPKVITIDYGEGCTVTINGEDYTRKGKIQITVTGRWFLEGATRTTTFIDFFVNDVKVEGTRTVVNTGENENGNLVFEHELTDGKLIFNDTLEYTRTATTEREWVRAATPLLDEWYISGSRSGVNAEGYEYSHEIIERLRMIRCEEYRYQWLIVEGVVEITRNGQTGTINYGDGSCDDTAILTIDGEEREIEVRQRYHKRRRFFARKNN